MFDEPDFECKTKTIAFVGYALSVQLSRLAEWIEEHTADIVCLEDLDPISISQNKDTGDWQISVTYQEM
jgi:endonuclease/exonuclease/phosphatase family metal-dependent hydrolase